MKKIYGLILIVFFSVFVVLTTTFAEGTQVKLSNEETLIAAPRANFTTTIKIEGAEDMVGFQFRLLYDQNKFQLISLEQSSEVPSGLIYNLDVIGQITINYSNIDAKHGMITELFHLIFKPKNHIEDGTHGLLSFDETYDNMVITMDEHYEMIQIDDIVFDFSQVKIGIYGDVSLNDQISIIDVAMIQLHLAGKKTLSTSQLRLADVNLDGEVNIIDVILIQLYLVGRTSNLGNPSDLEIDPEYPNIPIVFPDAVLANGEYNFKFANANLRNYLFAMAEKYLLNTMHAGIPVYANAGFSLFSPRMQLASEESLPVIGFGQEFSTMIADDSNILMEDGNFGQIDKYTLRTAISYNPSTFNHWIYNDATTANVFNLILDSLYAFRFNEDKTGYQVVPSMASADPVPIDSEELSSGKVISNTWRIPLRSDLKFTYHANTDTSGFPVDHEKINAHTFVNTFKYAIDHNWFRAISGGTHFWSPTSNIVNAKAYRDFVAGVEGVSATTWDQVGIKAIDDNTIEFKFASEMTEWNVKYWLSSFILTPINFALLNSVGSNNYGTSPETTAYTGIYKLDYYEPNRVLRMSRNENFHDQDLVFYTGQQITVINDVELRYQEFLANKLDVVAVPAIRYEDVEDNPGLKIIPGPTTFRIMINGFGTKEALQERFPDTNYTPKPILANTAFKQAMYFVIDRKYLTEEILKTYNTQMYLFTDIYLVDSESGIPYRKTEHGQMVGEGLSPDTYGYDLTKARSLYLQALDELIAEGKYTPGTVFNPTIIDISLYVFAGSTDQELFAQYIKTAFESAFNDTIRHIKVVINYETKPFPGIYYDYMMTGNFDLSMGGISGTALDAAGFLDTYNSDNRGGFTLNWGIDTSIPEIELTYINFDGILVTEIWSYDALQMALNGPVTVIDGREVSG